MIERARIKNLGLLSDLQPVEGSFPGFTDAHMPGSDKARRVSITSDL
jgi:hypothetical protein